MPISVPPCLELQGPAGFCDPGGQRFWPRNAQDVGQKSESEGGAVSLNGKEMGFHRSFWGPAAMRAAMRWSGARQKRKRREGDM